jgi:hypothetical protein
MMMMMMIFQSVMSVNEETVGLQFSIMGR